MKEIGKKYISAISFIFLIGISISLAENYSLPIAVALALVSTVLAILVRVSKRKFRHSIFLAFLLASLWEFFCSYLTLMLGYPLWKIFFNAGIGGIVVTAIIAIGGMIKAKGVSAEVK